MKFITSFLSKIVILPPPRPPRPRFHPNQPLIANNLFQLNLHRRKYLRDPEASTNQVFVTHFLRREKITPPINPTQIPKMIPFLPHPQHVSHVEFGRFFRVWKAKLWLEWWMLIHSTINVSFDYRSTLICESKIQPNSNKHVHCAIRFYARRRHSLEITVVELLLIYFSVLIFHSVLVFDIKQPFEFCSKFQK